MSIFLICVICLFIKVVGIVVLEAISTAIEDNSWIEMALSVGCLLAFGAVAIFFYPYAILSFYNQMILPLSPLLPKITYWQFFWIRFVAGIIFMKTDYNFEENT